MINSYFVLRLEISIIIIALIKSINAFVKMKIVPRKKKQEIKVFQREIGKKKIIKKNYK